MINFLYGGIVALCAVAALSFLRFRAQTQDRFFGMFAAAFATLGISYVFLAAGDTESEFRPFLYLIRLLAFLLIIAAIVDKNRHTDDT